MPPPRRRGRLFAFVLVVAAPLCLCGPLGHRRGRCRRCGGGAPPVDRLFGAISSADRPHRHPFLPCVPLCLPVPVSLAVSLPRCPCSFLVADHRVRRCSPPRAAAVWKCRRSASSAPGWRPVASLTPPSAPPCPAPAPAPRRFCFGLVAAVVVNCLSSRRPHCLPFVSLFRWSPILRRGAVVGSLAERSASVLARRSLAPTPRRLCRAPPRPARRPSPL